VSIDYSDIVGWPAKSTKVSSRRTTHVTWDEQVRARAELSKLGALRYGTPRTRELWQRAMHKRRWSQLNAERKSTAPE
jgi:hypothetical protein